MAAFDIGLDVHGVIQGRIHICAQNSISGRVESERSDQQGAPAYSIKLVMIKGKKPLKLKPVSTSACTLMPTSTASDALSSAALRALAGQLIGVLNRETDFSCLMWKLALRSLLNLSCARTSSANLPSTSARFLEHGVHLSSPFLSVHLPSILRPFLEVMPAQPARRYA